MFTPLEIVGDTAFRTTDQKVRGSNPFERAHPLIIQSIMPFKAQDYRLTIKPYVFGCNESTLQIEQS
jgi:hypothetical protein